MKSTTSTNIIKGWYFKDLPRKQIASRIIFYVLVLSALIVGAICVKNAMEWVDKPFPGFLLSQRLVVGHIAQYHWTGPQAGLRSSHTKILKVNDQAISSTRELDEIMLKTKIGDPVKYHIERDNKVIEVVVPTMRFTQLDLLMTFGIIFFTGMLLFLIGIVVFILKPDTTVSWVFFVGCFLQGISSFSSFDLETTHFGFVRAALFNDPLLPAVLLHLSMLFPEKARFLEKYPRIQIIPYIISVILIFPLELLYPRPSFAPVYAIVLFYEIIGVMTLIASILYAYIKNSSALARQRAKVVLVGALIALPLPATAIFLAFLGETLGKLKIATNFSTIPIIIFPASIAYAIAKHNLFDVDVYIKRTVGYGIMTALVGTTYFSIQMIMRPVVHSLFGEYSEKVYPVLFAILVVFLFNPINRRVQGAVDKLFYRKKFDYKETVISVSNALTSVLNLTEVIKRIINTVRKEMFIDTAGIILFEPQKKDCQTLFIGDESGSTNEQINKACIPYDDQLLNLISKEKKLITKYDIEEDPRYTTLRESCGQRLSEMGASILTPFIYQGEVTGALALGYKKSGHFYTREDIDLLNTLANHGAVAIENARLAEQMKKEEAMRTNLARYLSPQIVDQIITQDVQVNLGGDRKVVTVLFSDIRNFTSITETRQPDQLVQILNEYFTEMARIIFENQGSLDKYIGDAIVAVFGSLITLENSAKNAVQAATQMMKQLPALNEKWMREYGFSMDIGIGINTGEVFLGNIGSPERMEFTVIGDTVNVASRFSGLAQPRQILITRETLDFLGNDVSYKELPASTVKGKAEKLKVFEIPYL